MQLDRVMDEIARAITVISGIEVFPYPPATISGRSGYISYPASVDFDITYGRGEDVYTDLPITILCENPTYTSTRDVVAGWVASSGPKSIKEALENYEWTTCDIVNITKAEFEVETVASIDYLAVVFRAQVSGEGGM